MRSGSAPYRATTSSAVACDGQMIRCAERAASRVTSWNLTRVRGAKSAGPGLEGKVVDRHHARAGPRPGAESSWAHAPARLGGGAAGPAARAARTRTRDPGRPGRTATMSSSPAAPRCSARHELTHVAAPATQFGRVGIARIDDDRAHGPRRYRAVGPSNAAPDNRSSSQRPFAPYHCCAVSTHCSPRGAGDRRALHARRRCACRGVGVRDPGRSGRSHRGAGHGLGLGGRAPDSAGDVRQRPRGQPHAGAARPARGADPCRSRLLRRLRGPARGPGHARGRAAPDDRCGLDLGVGQPLRAERPVDLSAGLRAPGGA